MELKDLQKIQENYDENYWELNLDEFEKIRHITLHMGKLMGKISGYCEEKEHNVLKNGLVSTEKIKNEIIPDLLVYSLQLSNILKLDLETEYLNRLEKNKKFFDKN